MPEAARRVALSWGATHQGPRPNNEDTFHCDDERGIYFVIDGMGGHAAGEEAAAIAQQRLIGRLERAVGTPEQRVREAITLANNAILEAAQTRADWHGMACVLTVAVVTGNEVTVGHVGDSRLYRVLPDRLEKVTYDHSPVGVLEDRQEIPEADAMRHPRRNEVFRDVGSQRRDPDDPGFIDVYRFPFDPATAFFICSDGLSDVLSSEDMRGIIEENAPDRVQVVETLIETALENGKDNTTAVFVQGAKFGAKPRVRRKPAAPRNGRKRARSVEPDPIRETEAVPPPLRRRAPQHELTEPRAIEPAVSAYETPRRWPRAKAAAWMAAIFLAGVLGTLGVQKLWIYWAAGRAQPGVLPIVIRVRPDAAVRTISAAIEKAGVGDTIEISAGEYTDQVRLKSGVKLMARDAVLKPPPDISPLDAVITGDNVEQASVTGLRIRPPAHGGMGVGIRIVGGRVDLIKLNITGARLAAIEYSGNAMGTINACAVTDNPGTGILIRESAAPSVLNNRIENNGHGTARLPGLHLASVKAVAITGNTFLNNGAEAIWLPERPTLELLNGNAFGPNRSAGTTRNVRITGPLEVP